MRTIATVDSLDIQISASANTAVASLRQLNSQFDVLNANLQNVGSQVRNSFSGLRNVGTQIGSSFSRVSSDISRVKAGFSRIDSNVKKLTGGFAKINDSAKTVSNGLKNVTKQLITMGTAFKGIQGLKSAIAESANYIEVLNYFDRAFEQVASKADLSAFSEMGYESAERYFDSFSERARQLASKMSGFDINIGGTLTATGGASLGLDPGQVMNYQAMFAQMASSMGVASETALKLSDSLVMIGADLASVRNMDFDKTLNDMASGLVGMSRTWDKYGVNIRSVNMQQKLNELGIKANINSLNQNDKALLRTIILLDSTKYAFGDLANTINQPMNQLRLLESNIKNLARTIGNLFLPIVAKVLPFINGLVIASQRLFAWIGKIFKIDLSELMPKGGGGGSGAISDLIGDTGALEDGLNAATAAAKKLNKQVRAFDELNVINTSSAGAGGAGAGGISSGLLDEAFNEAFSDYLAAWNAAFDDVENKANSVANAIGKFFIEAVKPITAAWNTEGEHVIKGWKFALDEVWKLIKDIGRDFVSVWQSDETIRIFEDIFHIIGDIGLVVGNLASNFRSAWNENNVGLEIFKNIRDIIEIIVEHIKNAADATVEWSANLDFYPILNAFNTFLESFKPAVDALGGILEDFYTKVLLSIRKWTLEEGLPKLLDVFTAFNEKVDWEALRGDMSEFWQHLEPFAETVGEGLIIFIERVSDAIANFFNSETFVNFLHDIENWMDNVTPEGVADGIEKLAKAFIRLKIALAGLSALTGLADFALTMSVLVRTFGDIKLLLVNVFEGIKTAIAGSKIAEAIALWTGGAGTFSEVLQAVFTPLQGVIATVTGAFMAISNFVTMLKDGFSWLNEILMVAGTALAAVGAVILGAPALVAGIAAAVVAAVGTIVVVIHDNWNAICEWFSGVADWINMNVIQSVIGSFQRIWTNVSGFFKNLWNDITGIWSVASGWFSSNVIEPITNFFQGLGTRVKQIFEGLWIITQAVWKIASGWFNENVIIPVVGFFQGLWESVSGFFKSLWEDIVAVWTSVSEWFDMNIITPVTDFFRQLWKDVSGFFSNLWEDIQTVWETVAGWFDENIITPVQNAFETACDAIGGFFSSLWDGIKKGVVGAMNAVLGGIESAINFIVGGINSIIGGFNKIVSWAAKVAEVDWGGVDLVPKVTLPRVALANGAVLRGGKPFMAWVNDQPRGQTNVETPLKVIKQALREELATFTDKFNTVQLTPSFEVGQFQPMPPPEFDLETRYQNSYQAAESYWHEEERKRMESGYNGYAGSESSSEIERIVYNAVYNATLAAMRNEGGTKVEVTLEGDAGKFFNYWQKEYMDRAGRIQKNLIPIFQR